MKTICIYAAADLHGRQASVEIIARQASRPEVQAVVLAGDLVQYRWGHDILAKLAALSKPVYAVRGNTDPCRIEHAWASSHRIQNLDLNLCQLKDFQFVGVSGTLPVPFRSRIGWFETRRLKRLAAMVTSQSIVVAHPPPWGVQDRVAGRWHAGSRGLRRLVETASPAVLICGHIHEAAGIARIGQTLVVNCALGKRGQGAIIRYDGNTMAKARML